MKFDYCLGNPPYQETKGGTKNVDIWPDFIKEASTIANKRCFIHPGRWIVPKKNMLKIRDSLIDNGLRTFYLYQDSRMVFPAAVIDGGISITYSMLTYCDNIDYIVHGDNITRIYDKNSKIFLNKYEEEIYTKLFTKIDPNNNMLKYVVGNIGAIGNCFGYDKYTQMSTLSATPEGLKNPIKIWAGTQLGYTPKYKWQYIEKDALPKLPQKLLSGKKIMLGVAGRQLWFDKQSEICGNAQIIDANAVADSSLFIFPKNQNERELQLIKSLFFTKTARYAMTLTMKSLYVMGFENIPDYIELAKLLPENELFTDQWFYKTFDFSPELINEIETRISEKKE